MTPQEIANMRRKPTPAPEAKAPFNMEKHLEEHATEAIASRADFEAAGKKGMADAKDIEWTESTVIPAGPGTKSQVKMDAPLELADPQTQSDEQLAIVVRECGLPQQSAAELVNKFAPLMAKAKPLFVTAQSIKVTDVSDVQQMKLARSVRLAFREIRIAAEKLRKSEKQESLLRGKAIDGLFNVIAYAIDPVERGLQEQEDFAERKEKERLEALKKEREALLQPLGVDVTFYVLDAMPPDQFGKLLAGAIAEDAEKKRKAAEEEQKRIAAEKAEEERKKKEAEERERIRLENERLKREADERDRAAREAQEKADREAKAAKDKADREKAELEAKLKKEREQAEEAKKVMQRKSDMEAQMIRQQAEENQRVEREKRLEAERELENQKKAQKAKEEAIAKAQAKAARAPDAAKLRAYAAALRAVPVPEFKTAEAKTAWDTLAPWLEDVFNDVEKKAKDL